MSGHELVPDDYVHADPSDADPNEDAESQQERFRRSGRARRASANDVWFALSSAKDAGDIFGYKKVKTKQGTRWIIQTVPTRYDHYHDPEAQGTIVLSNREVMAFTEGRYAAMRLTYDADGRGKRVEGERWHPVDRAGDSIR